MLVCSKYNVMHTSMSRMSCIDPPTLLFHPILIVCHTHTVMEDDTERQYLQEEDLCAEAGLEKKQSMISQNILLTQC